MIFFILSENVVNCRNFIEKNCLAFTLSALSCHDANLRGAAYHVLTQFYRQMEGSKFIEHEQFSYMLECVRNSVEQPNGKLACIITIFLVKVSQLLLQPGKAEVCTVGTFLSIYRRRPWHDEWGTLNPIDGDTWLVSFITHISVQSVFLERL